jgi:hypothetical protein
MKIELTLTSAASTSLLALARYVDSTPEKLALLFLEDGVLAYEDQPEELKASFNGEQTSQP